MNIACHCGQVKIKLTGDPVVDLYCHCRDCQRIAGGGCVPYSIYPHAGVEVTEGKTLKWALKDNQRTRCASCGTYLFGDPVGMGVHGISGFEVAVRMREELEGPVPTMIALTGYDGPEHRARALAAGFDHHVAKPVDFDALLRHLSFKPVCLSPRSHAKPQRQIPSI